MIGFYTNLIAVFHCIKKIVHLLHTFLRGTGQKFGEQWLVMPLERTITDFKSALKSNYSCIIV